jgi:hypothetical protein
MSTQIARPAADSRSCRATQKRALRLTYAKTISEMGHLFCDILTFAHTKSATAHPPAWLLDNAYAIRGKLKASQGHKEYCTYELDFRGSWPKQHYEELLMLQLELNSWLYVPWLLFWQVSNMRPARNCWKFLRNCRNLGRRRS